MDFDLVRDCYQDLKNREYVFDLDLQKTNKKGETITKPNKSND